MKRKMRVVATTLVATVIASTMLVGCGSSHKSESASGGYDYATEEAAYEADYGEYEDYMEYLEEASDISSNGSSSAQAEKVDESANKKRKLIRTVNISAETFDFDETTSAVVDKVAALGGYIESSSVDGNTNSYRRDASYTIRIPAESADQFIEVLDGKGNITHQSESVEDVTLSYVDIQSHKESLQIEYDRLQEMLGAAETVEDMIYIEDRLSNIRYQIQSIESQLRTYDNKVDYTTIYLSISEVKKYTEPEPEDDSIAGRIKRGLEDASENIVDFISGLIVGIVVAIPYLIVVAIVIGIPAFIIVKIIRAAQKKSYKKAEKKRQQEEAAKAGNETSETADDTVQEDGENI